MKVNFTIPKITCKYCGHSYYVRKESPRWCPQCHNPVGEQRKYKVKK